MSSVKPIAAGFTTDAEKLLMDFLQEDSLEFSAFIAKWKQHKFVTIYMGHDKNELQQFTHEIFQQTLKFLLSPSFHLRAGAVYLLYALFRNQILNPPVRIRIMFSQFESLKAMQTRAEEEGYKTLHYVIEFLKGNGFDFVAYPTLCGPLTTTSNNELDRSTSFQIGCMLRDMKSQMSNFLNSDLLKNMNELNRSYADMKKRLVSSEMCVDISDYDRHIEKLSSLVGDRVNNQTRRKVRAEPDIGVRRHQLKSAAFSKRTSLRQLNLSEESEEEVKKKKHVHSAQKGIFRRRRKRRTKKVGRPKKSDELEALLQDLNDEKDEDSEKIVHITRRRGPSIRMSYLDRYDLKPSPCKQPELPKMPLYSSSEEDIFEVDVM